MSEKFTATRAKDYSEWYNQIVTKADLAEHSDVRGCMVIKPYGYAIWEKMQSELDKMFKATGHQNAYFPLFIPKSHLNKEADHVEGFAKECAVVTHYRLKIDDKTNELIVDPEAKLDEELIVRPTSETIIWNTYRKWIKSYRDLPILINQWANVVRWEMRTRLFLRTTEFLWQEGHTAHATEQEALQEAKTMLDVYTEFVEEWLAVPVIRGTKTESERFAGALETFCIEALMQDGKALQAGTSHFLGQNFAKAFDVKFADRDGKLAHVWSTSWGVTTRLIGALVMSHSDDKGLVLPPKLAPNQVVVVPIYKGDEELQAISKVVSVFKTQLENAGISVKFDDSDAKKPGWKFAEYEMKGVPVRIAIGSRDLESGTVEVVRRDTLEKMTISITDLQVQIPTLLEEIQNNLFNRATAFRDSNTHYAEDYNTFKNILEEKGGFVEAYWDGTKETENRIKEETKATIRCIPLEWGNEQEGKCILTGKNTRLKVLFAKAY